MNIPKLPAKTSPFLWGALAGAIALAIVGFNWGGWVTGGTSENPDPVYAARISLDRSEMQIEDKLVSLSPGMAVTVEIKTGSRSVISYLLSPLRKYKQESLRER